MDERTGLTDQDTQIDALSELGWKMSFTGRYHIKDDPDVEHLYWFVEVRDDKWYWHTEKFNGDNTSSEFGPFSSWMSAAADCEVAHRTTV